MIIDGHAHVILPVASHLALMDNARVDRTVLFTSRVHPEQAQSLAEFNQEMETLNAILRGERTNTSTMLEDTHEEHYQVLRAYPERFIGFGSLPLDLTYEATAAWIEKYIVAHNLYGLGEFTLASGRISLLAPIFELAYEFSNLPLWVHTFAPLTLDDIRELIALARLHPDVPLILGHLGGLNWQETIQLAKEMPQIYLDLSAAYTILAPALAIRELPERTLFGSDAPYGNPLVARTMVEQVTDSPSIRKLVLGETMAQLLGITE